MTTITILITIAVVSFLALGFSFAVLRAHLVDIKAEIVKLKARK